MRAVGSDKPGDNGYDYTLSLRIEDLERLVDHLDLGGVTLVVHDWGGAIGDLWRVGAEVDAGIGRALRRHPARQGRIGRANPAPLEVVVADGGVGGLANVAPAIAVAVRLRGVRHVPAVVVGVDDTVQITVEHLVQVGQRRLRADHHEPRGEQHHRPVGIQRLLGGVGYIDERGRLWFCGRKSHRVALSDGTTRFTVPCEAIFNEHSEVHRTALVGVDGRTVLLAELEGGIRKAQSEIASELLELGRKHPLTEDIDQVLFHPAFPVDVRHNAKIHRGKLAEWAKVQLASAHKAVKSGGA